MRGKIILVLVLFTTLISLCSCDGAEGAFDYGYVYFSKSNEKALLSDTDARLYKVQYKATALFELKGDHPLQGQTADWVTIGINDEGYTNKTGPFSQGYWRFEIKALNRSDVVLYVDTQDVYVKAGEALVVEFDPKRAEGEGAISVNIHIPNAGQTVEGNLTATFDCGDGSPFTVSEWEITLDESGNNYNIKKEFTAKTGSYTVTFFNGNLAGESVGIEVLASETAHITGWLYPSLYKDTDLDVTWPVSHTLTIKGNTEVSKGVSTTLSVTVPSGHTATWYVNGESKGTGSSFNFSQSEPGLYEVVCVSYKKNTYEESVSGCITIRVTP